jgi:cell division septation protein DedD
LPRSFRSRDRAWRAWTRRPAASSPTRPRPATSRSTARATTPPSPRPWPRRCASRAPRSRRFSVQSVAR